MSHKTAKISTASIIFSIIIWATVLSSLGDVQRTQLTTDSAHDWSPAITQTNDGKIWIAWHSFRTGNTDLFYKTYNGTSWSPDTQLTTNPNIDGLPCIIQTSDGKIWVVWTSNRAPDGNYDLSYKTSSDNGSSWSAEKQLTTNPDHDKHPSIVQTKDGEIWVIWESHRNGNYDLFYKTYNGTSWSPDMPLTTDPKDDKHPSIIQTSDGKIWVVWTSNRAPDGNEDLYYITSSDGGSYWSAETQLTTDLGTDSFPTIMQAHDGTIWVAWQAYRNIQDDIYYKIYNGSSWSLENKLTWFMDDDIMPCIYQAANGTIWLAWASDKTENFDIYYKFVTVDIAIKNVTISATEVLQGSLVNISVEVQNEGTAGATFNVTVYYNETIIETHKRTLVPQQPTQPLIFTWNTTGVTHGNYTIFARINPVQGEIDTADNTRIGGTVTVGIPDVAVKNVSSSKTIVHKGYPVDIYVEVRNEGTLSATFNVTAYFDSTKIGTQTVTLTPNTNVTLAFPWNTASVPYGYYTISANASLVLGETDLADNSLTNGTVMLTIPGDINGDQVVDIADSAKISVHYYYPPYIIGPLGYHPNADINSDGNVDVSDAAIVNANWNKSW